MISLYASITASVIDIFIENFINFMSILLNFIWKIFDINISFVMCNIRVRVMTTKTAIATSTPKAFVNLAFTILKFNCGYLFLNVSIVFKRNYTKQIILIIDFKMQHTTSKIVIFHIITYEIYMLRS